MSALIADFDRARQDSAISLRRLAAASDLNQSYLSQIFAGDREPSVTVLTAISRALGGDLSIRFYPSGGPQIHDRVQGRIVEELLHIAHPSWDRLVEVPVTRPIHGFIDVVFDSEQREALVATEVESRIDRLEQQVRRADEKARAVPSSDLWSRLDGERRVYRLLVLRSTAATREIARRFEATLAAAYPAHAADLYAALTERDRPWPGHGILWADVRGDAARILPRPPRGVALGR